MGNSQILPQLPSTFGKKPGRRFSGRQRDLSSDDEYRLCPLFALEEMACYNPPGSQAPAGSAREAVPAGLHSDV